MITLHLVQIKIFIMKLTLQNHPKIALKCVLTLLKMYDKIWFYIDKSLEPCKGF